ncbi:MAG: AAA family ATPase [Elusimicrobia bacterium]|nr:AAA family ATPase [Elusimicrobiota bacterium]
MNKKVLGISGSKIQRENGAAHGKALNASESPNIPPIYSRANGEFEPVSLSSLEEPERREVGLLNGRLVEGYPAILYGDGSHGKSYIAQAIALGMASGKGFGGMTLPPGSVLCLDWELNIEEQLRRAYSIARGLGMEEPPQPLYYAESFKPLPQFLGKVRKYIEEQNISLVVVDSFGPAYGVNPESAEVIIKSLNKLRELGVTVLLIDHQSKLQDGQAYGNKTPFGSAYKYNLARSVLHVEKIHSSKGLAKVLIRHKKNNFGPLCEDLGINIYFKENATVFTGADTANDPDFQKNINTESKILAVLRRSEPLSGEDIAQETGINHKTIANRLPALEKAGKIQHSGKEGRKNMWEAVK